ncbi:MAG: hypothetical protein Q8P53_04240 [Candidatus Shapirobacteria bacterium]|nr:hypothetical protein [Candidatus Shapirobacteria bacterium]
MKLPSCLTTVTPFSKIIAVILFITLPFFGLKLGMKYQRLFDSYSFEKNNNTNIIKSTPTDHQENSLYWLTYENSEAKFQISYPSYWTLKTNYSNNANEESAVITGEEGMIDLRWEELGGACPNGYEKLTTKGDRVSICRNINSENVESWSVNSKNIGAFVTVNKPTKTNRELLLKILSTLDNFK